MAVIYLFLNRRLTERNNNIYLFHIRAIIIFIFSISTSSLITLNVKTV
jgi:hypothetical protein